MEKIYETIKNRIKGNEDITVFILICVALISTALYYELTPTDMLWNFGNIYKIYAGQKMYADANIIITPIFFEIGKMFFTTLGANFFVYNIYGYLLDIIMYFLIYKILKNINLNKKISMMCIILIILISQKTLTANGANYNTLAFIFVEIGLLLNLKLNSRNIENKFNKKNVILSIANGILIVLTFFTYQKAGAGYFLAIIAINILNNKKSILKNISITFISMAISTLIMMMYLYNIGIMNDMINMCILGISDFANNNWKVDASVFLFSFLVISSTVFSVIICKKNEDENAKNTIKIMLPIALGNMLICIPILNYYHILYASIFFSILLIQCLNICLKELTTDEKIDKTINITLIIAAIAIISTSVYKLNLYVKNIEKNKREYSNIYYGAITDKLEENIEKIDSYIVKEKKSGKKVVILSSYAMLYPENYSSLNGMFDLPNSGNYGKEGEKGLIEKIKNLPSGTIILVQNKERSEYEIYQYATKTREYIYNNYTSEGIIENYDIFVKN